METALGYGPGEAIEVQSLMGDAIDNVPGIPGVGEKTAAKLIKKYGRAEAVLEHLDELTPKMRENFEKFGDRLPIARQLVTLKTDVEFDFQAESCRFTGLNDDALKKHLRDCGFTSLLKRMGEDDAGVKPQAPRRSAKYQPFEQGLFGPMGGNGDDASKQQADGP